MTGGEGVAQAGVLLDWLRAYEDQLAKDRERAARLLGKFEAAPAGADREALREHALAAVRAVQARWWGRRSCSSQRSGGDPGS